MLNRTVAAADTGSPTLNRRAALGKIGLGLASTATLATASIAAPKETAVPTDPIFARIEEWMAAEDALEEFGEEGELANPDFYQELEDRVGDAQVTLYATKATTFTGVIAFASLLATDDRCDEACIGDVGFKQAASTMASALSDIECRSRMA